jgi:hypothetical protein
MRIEEMKHVNQTKQLFHFSSLTQKISNVLGESKAIESLHVRATFYIEATEETARHKREVSSRQCGNSRRAKFLSI